MSKEETKKRGRPRKLPVSDNPNILTDTTPDLRMEDKVKNVSFAGQYKDLIKTVHVHS